MLTLGLAGGLDPVYDCRYDAPQYFTYDAAAVLVEDGQVVAAIEEERLNRVRRTNKFPFDALRACLRQRGVSLGDVDRIAYYSGEEVANLLVGRLRQAFPELAGIPDARGLLRAAIQREMRCELDPARIVFVPHGVTHAVSAAAMSGFEQALVYVIDNEGGVFTATSDEGCRSCLTPRAELSPEKSLGELCHRTIRALGYSPFEEAEAMELAPHGDPAARRDAMRGVYTLLPDGDYELAFQNLAGALSGVPGRLRGEPVEQAHRDVIAALEEAISEIVLHVLRHHRTRSGLRRLCLAGGGAQICAVNSRILASGLFDEVFVQPAAHDAGCALGAALHASDAPPRRAPLDHVAFGTDLGTADTVLPALRRWGAFVAAERSAEPAREAAGLVAAGSAVGWANGRSELGLVALGRRVIVADPRDERRRAALNALKRRAPHRPLSVAMLAEDARELLVLPCPAEQLRWKSFALRARRERREALAAALHADGTVRARVVLEQADPRLFALLSAFKALTGVGALLTTSLDHGAEPPAETVDDVVALLLTSDLEVAFVGDVLVRKRSASLEDRLRMAVELPRSTQVCRARGWIDGARVGDAWELRTSHDRGLRRKISGAAYDVLAQADGARSIAALCGGAGADVADELWALWTERLVRLWPAERP
ncbi:carbamoyltransferase C-terminal domain-containing protein [Sorangium sp. So ce1036]|uniref:carbamoyltransferase C-terminal domain-containing protein n=1 Tax=Sorangium sp. So ce1036 TaxID=3133328 RepID=UPI003F0BBEC3